MAAPPARLVFGAYIGAVMAHFVIDAGLWRLRDTFPKQFLSTYLPYLVRRRSSAHTPRENRATSGNHQTQTETSGG